MFKLPRVSHLLQAARPPPCLSPSAGGALTTFADARVGMDICMLDAAPETLAKKISQSARELLSGDQAGGLGERSAR